MKRSEINIIMREGIDFLARMGFHLPPFAFWSPEDWREKGEECRGIAQEHLGWDVTDFGLGDFACAGLFLFTLRTGLLDPLGQPLGKPYAEKIMIVREGQLTPAHFHHLKMEDIINRGGGNLVMQFWNATVDEELADTDVTISVDSIETRVPAAGTLTLRPGESITLPQRVYHAFWGEEGGGTVLVGEVSSVNDDHLDNRFYDVPGRFPEIEEDEPPLHLLCNDYPRYYRFA